MDKMRLGEFFCGITEPVLWGLGGFNFILLLWISLGIVRANDKYFKPKGDASFQLLPELELTKQKVSEEKSACSSLEFFYTLYVDITCVFPVLGVLGTVAALVTYSSEAMMEKLMTALFTTLLGAAFAAIFKIADAFISAPLNGVLEKMDRIMGEFDAKGGRRNEK